MDKLIDVSGSPVTDAGRGSPADIVVEPPISSMEDQVGPVDPVVGKIESGGVVSTDVMLESPP